MKQCCKNCTYWLEYAMIKGTGLCKKKTTKDWKQECTHNAGEDCEDFKLKEEFSQNTKLNLLGFKYEIEFTEPSKLTNSNMGTLHLLDQKIYLEKGWKKEQNEKSLLHEILHFIDVELGLNMGEETIKPLSHCLWCILKENNLFSSGFG